MGANMKLLFEGWRKYLDEADTDEDGIDDEKELAIIDKGEIPGDTDPEQQQWTDLDKAEELIEKYSFNSGKSSQHRWGRGMPIVDYDIDETVYENDNQLVFTASIQIEPPPMAQRSFGEEMDLEREVHRVLEKVGLGKNQGLSHVNIRTEPHSLIYIDYVPKEQGIKNLEPFLKHVAKIAARFQELRITDQLYKQQELPLPEA